MRIGAFEINEPVPELKQPHAIAVLRPWINVGRVGTLALSRLEQHLGARDLGQLVRPGLFYDFTRYRPRRRIIHGQPVLNIPNSVIRCATRDEGPDFLFFHLREPHASGEEFSESVLEILKAFGVKRYCLIGGMYDIVPHTRKLLVSGSSSSPETDSMLKSLGVQVSNYEGPTTITYLINQGVPKSGMDHATMIVRLPQYVQLEEDHAGTARLMELLGAMYDLPGNLINAEKGQRQYQELTAAVEQNPEVQQVLRELETQYDSRERPALPEPGAPLSPAVERFLQQLDLNLEEDSGQSY